MLTSDHVHQVCRYGQGPATCRYLSQLTGQPGQFGCAKLVPLVKSRIDDMVANSMTTIVGRGDNCDGKK